VHCQKRKEKGKGKEKEKQTGLISKIRNTGPWQGWHAQKDQKPVQVVRTKALLPA
jgi:hypothetical protein